MNVPNAERLNWVVHDPRNCKQGAEKFDFATALKDIQTYRDAYGEDIAKACKDTWNAQTTIKKNKGGYPVSTKMSTAVLLGGTFRLLCRKLSSKKMMAEMTSRIEDQLERTGIHTQSLR